MDDRTSVPEGFPPVEGVAARFFLAFFEVRGASTRGFAMPATTADLQQLQRWLGARDAEFGDNVDCMSAVVSLRSSCSSFTRRKKSVLVGFVSDRSWGA